VNPWNLFSKVVGRCSGFNGSAVQWLDEKGFDSSTYWIPRINRGMTDWIMGYRDIKDSCPLDKTEMSSPDLFG
jgi:hypothetical protein